jgi:hypothetical protein
VSLIPFPVHIAQMHPTSGFESSLQSPFYRLLPSFCIPLPSLADSHSHPAPTKTHAHLLFSGSLILKTFLEHLFQCVAISNSTFIIFTPMPFLHITWAISHSQFLFKSTQFFKTKKCVYKR